MLIVKKIYKYRLNNDQMIQNKCLTYLYDGIYLIYEGVNCTIFKDFRAYCEKIKTIMMIKFRVFIQKIAFRKYVDVSNEVSFAINFACSIHFQSSQIQLKRGRHISIYKRYIVNHVPCGAALIFAK